MKKIYLFLLFLCLSATAGYAQTAAAYIFSRTTGTFTSIIGQPGTYAASISCDDCSQTGIPIGFSFVYCGTTYSNLAACSNGWISLANNGTVGSLSGSQSYVTTGRLMPFWYDDYGVYTTAYYQTSGTVGSRVFTFEWPNWQPCCTSSGYNWNVQVKLFEGTNVVQFCYGSYSSTISSFTIGIGNSSSDFQVLPSSSSLTTSTTFSSSCTIPANGTILQWANCLPSISGGTSPICVGSTSTLSPSPTGGTWTSASTGVATVSSSGVVTGVAAGTATISYAAPCGVTATVVVTVNALPAAPAGNAPFNACSTETLTASGAGTWSSSSTSIATVSPSTGSSTVVTGVSAGNANISFTLTSSGCTVVTPVTVNALPAISGGASPVCVGSTTTLSNSLTGGTWTSSNTSQATVGSSTGVVSGVATGTPTITYTVSGGCYVTKGISVNPVPAAITGAGTICGGSVPTTLTLSDATSGGTWSSGNTSLATVGSSSGVVTGVASGTPSVSYTVAGCSSRTVVTVNAVPAITGPGVTCVGTTTIFADLTPGGTWSCSNTGIATVGSTGVATGVSVGSANISYAVSSIGCSAFTTVSVTNVPTTYTVTGGGAYCVGTSGVHIGLNSSDLGVIYTLFNGGTIAGTQAGTGSSIDFGLFTSSGVYSVIANFSTSCAVTMSGTTTVTINPLPAPYSVAGGGAYCAGGTGVHVTMNPSAVGINYQLKAGTTSVGSPLAGTGSLLDFGLQTTAGTYTVVGTNAVTGCSYTMSGSAAISVNAAPASFSVTGGGSFCTGGSGVHVGLSGSATGVSYRLLLGGSPVGTALSGTGSALDFGLITAGGTYTVLATNTTTGCTATMSGAVTVVVNPLPPLNTVTGGGAYCSGGTGVSIGLNGSVTGINYQLFNGSSTVGSPVSGTGVSLSFGLQTSAGSYTAVATNASTGCVRNMSGSAVVTITPLPATFSVTGGGGYCTGGTGLPVGLSGSVSGTNYSLFNGGTLVGAASGTGTALSFGVQSLAGTYTVTAFNPASGCSANMTGSATITINPLPAQYTVTGGGIYCAGGSGVAVGLSSSNTGVNYQLYRGGTVVGSTVAGGGGAISFGLQTAAGSYTVVANATTGCTSSMLGAAVISVNPAPPIYPVTGGGAYCAGGIGLHVGLFSSNSGINYQLTSGGSLVGAPLAGTGSSLDYGLITAPGAYGVTATNPSTGCTATMSGTATIISSPLPTTYSVINGGSYCAGGSGVHVGLSGSDIGVNYELFLGITPVGPSVAGTGASIDFGLQAAPGTYTVIGINALAGCGNNMTGSVTVSTTPVPTVFSVTGGGTFCAGGGGAHVGLSGSVTGINYRLMNGPATVTTIPGTGSSLDFGLQAAAGFYTVVAVNPSTTCTSTMSGSATITALPLPAINTVTGGGIYCAGGAGLHVGLGSSSAGVSYQLYSGGPVGAALSGTGFALDFGLRGPGAYSVIATDNTTGCQATMTGTVSISTSPLPAPHTVLGGGTFCAGGAGVSIGIDGSNTGTNYQLFYGTVAVGAPLAGSTGFPLNFGLQTAIGSYAVVATISGTSCSSAMLGSASVGVSPLPAAYNVNGGGAFCAGGAGVHVGLSSSATGILYQLWNGSSLVGSVLPGTGAPIDFGIQLAPGTYTVTARNPATACVNNMTGSATVVVNPLPAIHLVTGGGDYCSGGTGVHIGLNGSDLSVSYQLLNSGVATGSPAAGTGSALDFGLETIPGAYTVVAANAFTSCINSMTGAAVVAVDPLPTAYTLAGGGAYCAGGTGSDVVLNGSDFGSTYQLYKNGTAVGSAVSGTGLAIDFGFQTGLGTYTVQATNNATSCTANMSNSVVVTVNPLPAAYLVTGGGNYCSGGTGVHVMLNGSTAGVAYQLLLGGSPVGTPAGGTGASIDFGLQALTGAYTVMATNLATACTGPMTGSVTVGTAALPAVFTLSGSSGSYCAGGAGVDVTLSGSASGVSYQLYLGGTPIGSPVAGGGGAIDFGHQFSGGAYTAMATSGAGCTSHMAGIVSIAVNSLPNTYSVTGGGSFCVGDPGAHTGLSGSDVGISYQLFRGVIQVGSALPGTSGPLDFGLQSVAGSYSVVATNTVTHCSSNMTGSATVGVNTPPLAATVSGGGAYCTGTPAPHVTLGTSTLGVNYQLYRGTTAVGSPIAGTGATIDFGAQSVAGAYTVAGTNAVTGCSANMSGSAVVSVSSAPAAFTFGGGGGFCAGSAGVHVGTLGSSGGVTYQLYNGLAAVGAPLPGTGSALDFGLQTVAGIYSVTATNTATGCTAAMPGTASVLVNALPTVYNVAGGGSYCASGTGVHIGLAGTQSGVNYTLSRGATAVSTVGGSGGPLDFGLQAAAGTYTVHAVTTGTGCAANMSGSAVVSVIPAVTPLVSINTVAGDTICEGSYTTFTAAPTHGGPAPTYHWSVNGTASGSGATYSYTPANGDVVNVTLTSSEQCALPSSAGASVTMTVDPVRAPLVSVSAIPGTVVCQGTGVTFTASPSYGGNAPVYTWYKNGISAGTVTDTYSYTPANGDVVYCTLTSNYHCRTANSAASSHITMEVDNPVTPLVSVTSDAGSTIAAGQMVRFTASETNGGPNPTYQWFINTTPVPGATSAVYFTNTLFDGDAVVCKVTSSGGCSGIVGTGSLSIHIRGVGVAGLSAAGSDIRLLPNPSKGSFSIKGTLASLADESVSIEITDMLGKVVYAAKVTAHNGAIDEKADLGRTIANGMYILSLHSDSENKVFHLVIEQ